MARAAGGIDFETLERPAATSFGNYGDLLRKLAGLDVGAKQVERHPEAWGAKRVFANKINDKPYVCW